METTIDLSSQTVLITGATRGLGLATARALCAAGCEVLLNYAHDDRQADQALATLRNLRGTAALIKGDVADPAGFTAVLDRVADTTGKLDVFVHNAASLHPMDPGTADLAGLHADLATALDPLASGAVRAAELMPLGAGRIIAVSSLGARAVIPRYMSLGAAKAALESLVRYLAVELAPRGVAVNAVSTAKLDHGGEPGPRELELARRSPSGRLTTPADVADVIALLCMDQAHWIRGQVITVDGGLGLRAP